MAKHSCLSCKNYCPEEDVVVGRRIEDEFFSVPIIEKKPHTCKLHPRIFKKWWEENANKPAGEAADAPKCLELPDFLKSLDEMIKLSKEILDKRETNKTKNE